MAIKSILLIATLLLLVSCSDPCMVAHNNDYYVRFCTDKGLQPLSDGVSEGVGFSTVFCQDNGELKEFTLSEYLKKCVDENTPVVKTNESENEVNESVI